MKADSPLKKHHFWLLCGVVPLFTLIGVSCVSSNVGGKIEEREKDIEAAKSAIASKQNPKPTALITEAGKLVDRVSQKQGTLHELNWNRQKHLFTWPRGGNPPLLKRYEAQNLKFGDPLSNTEGEFDAFQKPEVYVYEFSSLKEKDNSGAPGIGMADRIAPTQFRGGWRNVLRHVNNFGQNQLTKDQVWLMMEDIWVQRSLLDAVRSINVDLATFRRAKVDAKGDVVFDESFDDNGQKWEGGKKVETPDAEKKKAVFRNRLWAVELELKQESGTQRLVGTLTNLSERLQLMGVGNVMTLNVWLSKNSAQEPLVFKIGGEFLPGKGAMKRDTAGRDVPANVLPIVFNADSHTIPAAMSAEEIVRVEQVFDIRTVPVKRVEALALGFRDSRYNDKPLLPPLAPPFAPEPPAPEPAAGATGPMGGRGEDGGSLGPQPMGVGGTPTGPGTGFGGTNALRSQLWGGGPITAVIDGNKKRYLEVTQQVRRMPVGIVVVVDQAYMQDMLLAFANSPLRFQITQVTWTRFRGTLTGLGTTSGSTGPGAGIDYGSPGMNNISGPGDPDERPNSLSPRPGPRPIGPGAVSSGPPGPVGFGPMGPLGPGGYPGAGTSAASVVSESQITSGLVELSICGVVSLYEKFEAPKPPTDASATTTTAPAPMGATAPAPMTPMTPAPAPGAPPAKPRRRRARA